MDQNVDQVARLVGHVRDRRYALTSGGGIRPKRLLDSLRSPESRPQDEKEVKVPQETWD